MADEDLLLRDADIQEIQLELMRRNRFNTFDGPKVIASLQRHRELWLAAYMDRFGLYSKDHPDWIPSFSLIKLRDLPHNRWNVDTLCLLTKTVDDARRLAEVAEAEDWDAQEIVVQDNERELGSALGVVPCDYGVLTVWWD
jgi:hypothetical protein